MRRENLSARGDGGRLPTTTRRHAKKRRRVRLPADGARRGAVRRARASSPWAAAGGHDDDHSRRICAAGSGGPPARRACAGAYGRHGGLRRRQLLGAGLLRQPRGSAATGRSLPRHALLSPQGIGRSRRRVRASGHARQHHRQFQRKSQREPQRQCGCRDGDSELRVRDPGTGRPGGDGAGGADGTQQCLRGRDAECRDRPLRIQLVRRSRGFRLRLRRPHPAVLAALERRRSQLHDLRHRQYPGGSLRFPTAG